MTKVAVRIGLGCQIVLPRYGDIIPWDEDVDILVRDEDMTRLATVWNSSGQGFKSCRYPWHTLKLFSDVNYTTDYGKSKNYTYPFLDIFSFSENRSHVTYQKAGNTVLRKVVFPLRKVAFLGIPGVGVPRNIKAFLVSLYGRDISDTCISLNWDHRRETFGPTPELRVPCEKLSRFMGWKITEQK